MNRVPSFVPASASTTGPYLASCRDKSDRRRPTTVKPRAAWDAVDQDLFSIYRRAAQPSSSYGDSRAPHSRMEHDMDSRRGQRWVTSSKGVRAKQFARSIPKSTTRECVQTRAGTSIFTSWTAVEVALTRATLQRVPQIVGMRIFYCKLYRPNVRQFNKPPRERRLRTCRYPAYDGGHLRR